MTSQAGPPESADPERVQPPVRILRREPERIGFEWPDGRESSISARELRLSCPCARCVDEFTGAALLDPETVPEGLTQSSVELVGNYALSITFSDGHRTGIFTWAALRRLSGA
ncbi:MAG: DUF971 domain-containing protein [Planctomycetota bacterium]|nr:DUF971 domain-containing protein [Planctomycetota bacterium]